MRMHATLQLMDGQNAPESPSAGRPAETRAGHEAPERPVGHLDSGPDASPSSAPSRSWPDASLAGHEGSVGHIAGDPDGPVSSTTPDVPVPEIPSDESPVTTALDPSHHTSGQSLHAQSDAPERPHRGPHVRTGVSEADLVLRAAHALRRQLGGAMAGEDLAPHESRALRVIALLAVPDIPDADAAETSGPPPLPDAAAPRLSDIAGALRIAPRSATEVVDRLQALGLVVREPSPTDRRANLVRLTPHGRDVLRRVESSWTRAARDFLSPLTPAEVDQLTGLLTRLVDGSQVG